MGGSDETTVIRHATAADASELSHLAARTFRATYLQANDPQLVETYIAEHHSVAIQLSELGDERLIYLVAEVEGRLAGFALLRTDQSHPDVVGTHPMRLARIYVDASHLGRGLGSALMERCITECRARGHDVIWLGVWERNESAMGFYERWGFGRVGTELFDVGGDEQRDTILMLAIT
jgi:GNAT superfamily N-acetyltransferase